MRTLAFQAALLALGILAGAIGRPWEVWIAASLVVAAVGSKGGAA